MQVFRKQIGGFGLTQVLIAAALMGFVGLAITQLISTGLKGQRNIGQSADFQSLQNNIATALGRPALCSQIFVDTANTPMTYVPVAAPPTPASPIPPPPAVTPTSLNRINLVIGANSSPVLTRGQDLGAGLRITQMHFETLPGFPLAGTPIGPNVEHGVQLVLEVQRREGSIGPEFINNRRSPFIMALITTAAGQVIDCGRTAGGVSMGFRKRVPQAGPDIGSNIFVKAGPVNSLVPLGPSPASPATPMEAPDPDSAWMAAAPPLTRFSGIKCDATLGWKLVSCFGNERGGANVDILLYTEDLGSGVRTATGCMTDDWFDENDMELFIQCAK